MSPNLSRWLLRGMLLCIASLFIKWFSSYSVFFLSVVWWFRSLSLGGGILLFITLALLFGFVLPRLLGLGLSVLVFKAVLRLPFYVSVGSAGLGRLNNVAIHFRSKEGMKHSITLKVLEMAIIPSFMPMQMNSRKEKRKLITLYMRGASVEISPNDNKKPSSMHERDWRTSPRSTVSLDGNATKQNHTGANEGAGETSGGLLQRIKNAALPWAVRVGGYTACTFVGIVVVDTSARVTVPELGVVSYFLEQVTLAVQRYHVSPKM